MVAAGVAALTTAGLAIVGLAGCISLFPAAPPVQLYTFGELAPPAQPTPAASAAGAPRVAVVLTAVELPRAAAGDQILTLTGQAAAYLAGARWLTPAGVMFQSDAERALAAGAPHARLLARSESGAADALLRLDVADFEARYDDEPGSAPTVLVSLTATLSRPDGRPLSQRTFTVRQPAAENRVTAIVAAYDRATRQALSQVAAWTDAAAQPISRLDPS